MAGSRVPRFLTAAGCRCAGTDINCRLRKSCLRGFKGLCEVLALVNQTEPRRTSRCLRAVCRTRACRCEQAYPHPSSSQWKGLSPVWVRACTARWLRREQAYPHPSSSQWKGFSPVWVRACTTRSLRRAQEYPHPSSSQWKGFSPVCLRICTSSLERDAAAYPQPSSQQRKGRAADM